MPKCRLYRVNDSRRLWLAIGIGLLLLAHSECPAAEEFFVIDGGTALLGADGKERERLDSIAYAAGNLSPDGRWVAFARSSPYKTLTKNPAVNRTEPNTAKPGRICDLSAKQHR